MTDDEKALTLAGLAVIATMPEELPPPLSRVRLLVWFWAWVHDATKAFVSFRLPRREDTK